eukprot:3368349-Prymnesium_polylepis.1
MYTVQPMRVSFLYDNGLRFSIGARSGTSRCVARRARRILTSGRPRTGRPGSGAARRVGVRAPRVR